MTDSTPSAPPSPAELDGSARTLLAAHRLGVLATVRADGTPHLSTIAYGLDEQRPLLRVSLPEDRVKVRHLRRDPRASLHVATADHTSWVAVTGAAELTLVTARPGDEVGRELSQLYEQIAGRPHPNPQEFDEAMVRERRLVLRLHPHTVTTGGAS